MKGLVASDLDGTLLGSDLTIAAADLESLRELGRSGVVRCVATGRNLYSVRSVLPREAPIDYLVFSSGAGIVDWSSGRLLRCRLMGAASVRRALEVALAHGLDVMVHDPVPDNHRFVYFAANGAGREDFRRRLARYEGFARAGRIDCFSPRRSTQLVAVGGESQEGEAQYEALKTELARYSVLRSTSPLDGRSTWIEVFHRKVSKSASLRWIARRCGVQRASVLAVGNDWNDEDMLEWAGLGIVVAGAPAALRARFLTVGPNDACGFSEAVSLWRARCGPDPVWRRPPSRRVRGGVLDERSGGH